MSERTRLGSKCLINRYWRGRADVPIDRIFPRKRVRTSDTRCGDRTHCAARRRGVGPDVLVVGEGAASRNRGNEKSPVETRIGYACDRDKFAYYNAVL